MSGEVLPQSTQRDFKLLEQRLYDVEMRLQALGARSLDEFDDTQILYRHPVSAPGDGFVLTWDDTITTEFGGAWVPAPSIAGDQAVVETVGSWTDDGIFDETAEFTFDESVFVNGHSKQLVIVTARVSGISDSRVLVDNSGPEYVDIPTSWRLTAQDSTASGPVYYQNATGGGGAQVAFWISDDSDAGDDHVITTYCQGVTGAYEFDATVEVTIETVFSLVAV